MQRRALAARPLAALCASTRLPIDIRKRLVRRGHSELQIGGRVAGVAATLRIGEDAARSRRSSSKVKSRFASFDCPYMRQRPYERSPCRSSKAMRPVRWAPLLTLTTRASGRPAMRPMSCAGEREVAEVVRAELQLEAVAGELARRRHDAGVVDQQVERVVLVGEAIGELADGGEAPEV